MSPAGPDTPAPPAADRRRPAHPAATLTAEAAAGRLWDAVVVGAGPAGALAAGLLARRGLSTLLLDRARFPRGKVCGCCLNPRALDALRRAGLGELLPALGALPLDSVQLAAHGRRVRLALPGGASVSREALDAALVSAACARGAHFLPETLASSAGAPAPGAPRRVHIRHADAVADIAAHVVLVADGLGSRFLGDDEPGPSRVARGSRVGAGTVLAEAPSAVAAGSVWMACGEAGYVGLVRLPDGRLDVAAAFDARALAAAGGARGAGRLATDIIARAGHAALAGLPLAEAAWHGTPQLTRRPARQGARAALLVGDACGYVEPFTGDGMAAALCSALAVLPFAETAARAWDETLLEAWERCWQRDIGARQRTCRAVAWLLRHPRLLSPCLAALALRPSLASPLLAGLAAPSAPARTATGAAGAAACGATAGAARSAGRA